jgi:hypothetical protein
MEIPEDWDWFGRTINAVALKISLLTGNLFCLINHNVVLGHASLAQFSHLFVI